MLAIRSFERLHLATFCDSFKLNFLFVMKRIDSKNVIQALIRFGLSLTSKDILTATKGRRMLSIFLKKMVDYL